MIMRKLLNFAKKMDQNCKSRKIFTRPADNGLWMSGLITCAYLISVFRNQNSIGLDYKLTTIMSFGLFLQSLEIFLKIACEKIHLILSIILKLIPGLMTALFIWINLKQDVDFCLIHGICVSLIFNFVYIYVLKTLPRSFTLGEAAVVVQGFILFLYNCFLQLPFMNNSETTERDLNTVLQLGLLAVTLLVLIVHFISFFRKWFMFYVLLGAIVFLVCVIPIRSNLAIEILIQFLFDDLERIFVIALYAFLLFLAGITVLWHTKKNESTSTSIRKIFHVLTVLVFLPGLIYQCSFLYVASVVMLAILCVLETARIIQLYPVSDILETSVKAFIDEKDAGHVALTPVYLLVGCACGLWIHPSPCDLADTTDDELLPLLAGIVSVGVGDTFASVIGSKLGKHKWPESTKSVEGTLASIFGQSVFLLLLWRFGFLFLNMKFAAISGTAIILNALVEALTDQVDNLSLPLITFIILSYK